MISTIPHRLVFLLAGLLAFGAVRTAAQQTGRIVGKVVESKTGEGLPGANVVVKGTYYGGSSDLQGNFKVERVNPGSYTVEVTLLGFSQELVLFAHNVGMVPPNTVTVSVDNRLTRYSRGPL